jgi:hypothetical protein
MMTIQSQTEPWSKLVHSRYFALEPSVLLMLIDFAVHFRLAPESIGIERNLQKLRGARPPEMVLSREVAGI